MLKKPQSFDPRQKMNNFSFEVFHYRDPKPTEVEVHHHDFYEVYNLLAGEVKYWVDGKVYHLRPGAFSVTALMPLPAFAAMWLPWPCALWKSCARSRAMPRICPRPPQTGNRVSAPFSPQTQGRKQDGTT